RTNGRVFVCARAAVTSRALSYFQICKVRTDIWQPSQQLLLHERGCTGTSLFNKPFYAMGGHRILRQSFRSASHSCSVLLPQRWQPGKPLAANGKYIRPKCSPIQSNSQSIKLLPKYPFGEQ